MDDANKRVIKPYYLPLLLVVLYATLQSVIRLVLFVQEFPELELMNGDGWRIFGIGSANDLFVALLLVQPLVWYRILLAERWMNSLFDRVISSLFIATYGFVMLLGVFVELLFWEEFRSRIDQLGWDYLQYPNEVLWFLCEAFPLTYVVLLLLLIGIVLFATVGIRRMRRRTPCYRFVPATQQEKFYLLALTPPLVFALLVAFDHPSPELSDDHQVNELAKNGLFNFVVAGREYHHSFAKRYLTERNEASLGAKVIQELMDHANDHEAMGDPLDHSRFIMREGDEKRYNVIIVVMESMSHQFLEMYLDGEELTPSLNRLKKEGLYFSRHYATGTRTVRGLEAVTLSIPPTAGPSLLKRRDNGELFSIATPFVERGYMTRFIYNGHGRFDNQRAFFEGNGFHKVTDVTDFQPEEISHRNVWGVCDEDLYRKVIQICDSDHAASSHFLCLVLNTSNHPPFTFPKTHFQRDVAFDQLGAVAYADFALGNFIEEAKKRPWFDETIFVFVSDHAARSVGKREINPEKHRIPLIFYGPALIQPEQREEIASQIDIAPTICSLLNLSYKSRFYGSDLLAGGKGRAFLGTFDRLGLLTEDKLLLLKPHKKIKAYLPDGSFCAEIDPEEQKRVISLYHHASEWQKHLRQREE